MNIIVGTDSLNRAPFVRIAEIYLQHEKFEQAVAWAGAALQISRKDHIDDDDENYFDAPHRIMYKALCGMEEYNAAKRHFDICLGHQPFNSEYLADYLIFYVPPHVTINIDGTEDQKSKTLLSVGKLIYPKDKIDIKDSDSLAVGEWVVFIEAGFEFKPDCIMAAYKQALDNKKMFIVFAGGDQPESSFMVQRELWDKFLAGAMHDITTLVDLAKNTNNFMQCARAQIKKLPVINQG